MKKFLLACAAFGVVAIGVTAISSISSARLTRLEALPIQTTRRVFLRTNDAGWENRAYCYSWGTETKATPMTHVLDFGEKDSLYFVDINIAKVSGFLFLDGSAIAAGEPDWDVTDSSPWLKSQDATALTDWGKADVYVLKGVYGNSPKANGGNKLALSADQLATLLKRYTSCSADSSSYTNSCLAYPQLQANFNIDSFASNTTAVPAFAGGEKNGTTLGQKVTTMKEQYSHYDDDPAQGEDPVVLEKTEIKQTYADYIKNNIYALDGAPSVGECNLLVIPVWLTDSSTYISAACKSNVRADIEKAYLGSTTETGWHSVKSYYEAESGGALSIKGTVSNWYEPGISTSDAASYNSAATSQLVIDAADWYFAKNPSKSRADFDCDGNGYLDGVMLIYATPNYADRDMSQNNLWAYCYWAQKTSQRNYYNPGVNVFFWASYDFMYGSNTVASRTGKSGYYFGDTSHTSIDAHTYIHEMGHVFGLDDYYDYGPNGYSPAAGFSMQDYNVGGHDPYSTMALGWSDPYIPTESCDIQIGAFQTNHDLVLLTPSWNSYDSAFDEYLLLELYTPTGLNYHDSQYALQGFYPQGPKIPGIRLWHVDARLLYVNSDGNFRANQMTTNANYSSYYGVTAAFSNTYDNADYGSDLGSTYYNYNLLQLIRNDTSATYRPSDHFQSGHMFCDGDAFDMSTYSSQFVKGAKLNSGTALGWSFSVSIEGSGNNAVATIHLVRA